MSDQRSGGSHPGEELKGVDGCKKMKVDHEVLCGICSRTPLDLIIYMHGK